jgi:antitoxin CptB
MTQSKELLLKGLLYRSLYRGCKETDILVGKFAQAKLEILNDKELSLFESFTVEDDAQIYDWVLNKTPCPEKYLNLIKDIREFHDLTN